MSYKSYGVAQAAGVSILPTVREINSEEGEGLDSRSTSSSSKDGNDEDPQGISNTSATGTVYPPDLLGVSWGSYLYSGPPSRGELRENASFRALGENSTDQPSPSHRDGAAGKTRASNEPHPLVQYLEELMSAVVRSKEELMKCGVDASSLAPLSDLSLDSHYNVLQMTMKSKKGQKELNQAVIDSGMFENITKYVKEVLSQVVEHGKRTSKQANFLQHTARKLNENHQQTLNEQKSIQESIRDSRAKLELERQGLERDKEAVLAAKVELKRMLHKAELSLREREITTRRMDSPHTVAQGEPKKNIPPTLMFEYV